jgi:hypothetical protein
MRRFDAETKRSGAIAVLRAITFNGEMACQVKALNRRLVGMLQICGFDVMSDKGNPFGEVPFAPMPVSRGWRYAWPSLVVPWQSAVDDRRRAPGQPRPIAAGGDALPLNTLGHDLDVVHLRAD